MYRVDLNKAITLVRGDTLLYEYKINIGTDVDVIPYVMKEGDRLYFAVCEPNQQFEDAVIKKRYEYSDCSDYTDEEGNTFSVAPIKLSSDDTVNLAEGKYYYTIKLAKKTEDDYDVITTQPKTLFFLV